MKDNLIRVAYAEDHVSVRQAIVASLKGLGGIAIEIEADNGQELIGKLLQAKELPDICLLDINMPLMNGYETLTTIKKRWPKMRTLIFSLYEAEAAVIRMVQKGANGYVSKNSPLEELKIALETIYNDGFYYSGFIKGKLSKLQNPFEKPYQFTDRDIEFLKYCCTDLCYDEIAVAMNTTIRSIAGYRDKLFSKLNINSRVTLALFAVESGFV
ncbi:MAG: response regulator transcription factor [Bacteroidetes bacterium]|nr:response regulator transcription factor [Bacteroidota bacterium]